MPFYLGNAHTDSKAFLTCQAYYPIKAYINRWRSCYVILICQFATVRITVQTDHLDKIK